MEIYIQKSVALSTAEAEYYSASLGAVEVIYLRLLLRYMGLGPTSQTLVYEDNTACIEWTNNVIGGRERAKHMEFVSTLCAKLHRSDIFVSRECSLAIGSPIYSPRASSQHNLLQ